MHSDGMAKQRIFDAAEDAIIELSKKSRSEVSLPFITIDPKSSQPKHLNEGYSRAVLASAVNDLAKSHVSATFFKDGISEAFDVNVLSESNTPGAIMPPKYLFLIITSNVVAVPKSTMI